MIPIRRKDGTTQYVEGARIYLPGYEEWEFYAHNRIAGDNVIESGFWEVIEASSGLAITTAKQLSRNVEEAQANAMDTLRRYAPPYKLRALIGNAISQRGGHKPMARIK